MHVAAANYEWGVQPPDGFAMMTYEKSLTSKSDIQKALKASFAHVKSSLSAASDADIEKEASVFSAR